MDAMGHAVKVDLELPEAVSDAARAVALKRAHESAVLALWEVEAFSTREAAEELGLSYHDFLDLLTARGIPVVQGSMDMGVVEAARLKLAGDRP
jgi:hypothetical protein